MEPEGPAGVPEVRLGKVRLEGPRQYGSGSATSAVPQRTRSPARRGPAAEVRGTHKVRGEDEAIQVDQVHDVDQAIGEDEVRVVQVARGEVEDEEART